MFGCIIEILVLSMGFFLKVMNWGRREVSVALGGNVNTSPLTSHGRRDLQGWETNHGVLQEPYPLDQGWANFSEQGPHSHILSFKAAHRVTTIPD